MTDKKLSTDSYKGVRDFYPEEQFVHKYLLETMARTCEQYGFEEYDASILEPAELYRSKGAENAEMVNEQTYTFVDRGEREVALRPEMTPTVARMIAKKRRELPLPVRWYSIPNVFRYERPQRGRLREHWQLNADIFGAPGIDAEVEIILLAHAVMRGLGAQESDFEIRLNDRRFLQDALKHINSTADEEKSVMQLLDKRAKIDDFDAQLEALLGSERAGTLTETLNSTTATAHLVDLLERLSTLGVTNAIVDTSIVRGFNYYTGMVFEVFDTAPENNRSLFGGGRYDNLLDLFDDERVPAVGFGMGDVTAHDFLETRDLLPQYVPATELMLCVLDEAHITHAMQLAENLRKEDVTVAVNLSHKRAGDQIKQADKLGIPFVICIGDEEVKNDQYTIKQLETGDERTLSSERIAEHMFGSLG